MYQISQNINQDKIFIVKKSEIEGRLEPNFYRPSIATLEKKIRSLSSKRLRSYALSFAGGQHLQSESLKSIIQILKQVFHS